MKKLYIITMLLAFISLTAQALFEIKDASDNPVFSISDDGLRVFNLGDTLMVISATEIKANIADGKGKALSRSFSVTTSTTGKAGKANMLEVTTGETTMREGVLGNQYTDFSPDNIFIGLNSGNSTIPNGIYGVNNIFLGNESGIVNSSGYNNIFIGDSAGVSNTTGEKNVFIGDDAGFSNISGATNVFVGDNAGSKNTSGGSNVFVGLNAGSSNTVEHWNTYVGYGSGKFAAGESNAFFGYASGYDTTGDKNSFFGFNTGSGNGTGANNSFFGYQAGLLNSGGISNCVFGFQAGYGSSGNSDYNYNCLFGTFAGKLLEGGDGNVMMGYYAGQAAASSSYNVFLGYQSAYKHTSGSANVFVGRAAGYNNETGSGNICIGNYAGFNETGSSRFYLDNGTAANPFLFGTMDAPRMLVIDGDDTDNGNGRKLFVYGTAGGLSAWYNDSDERLKKNIETIDSPLDKISQLRGVTFDWKSPEKYEKGKKMGFIAQETIKVIPEVVEYNEEKDYYSMQYAPINALLVEAIKEQQEYIKKLESRLERIEK